MDSEMSKADICYIFNSKMIVQEMFSAFKKLSTKTGCFLLIFAPKDFR